MRHNISSVSNFLDLKNIGQNSATNTNHYSTPSYISPSSGVDIYLRACDKILTNFAQMKTIYSKLNTLEKDSSPIAQASCQDLRIEMTEHYTKTSAIISEFMKGFSVTYDISVKDYMSLLFRLFDYTSERFNLSYLSKNLSYLEEAQDKVEKARSLFLQMREILDQASQTKSDNVESQTNEISA